MVPIRDVAHIWDVWNSGGPFIGDAKPCTRVTVEKDFELRTTAAGAPVAPAKWYECPYDDSGWDFARELSMQSEQAGAWNSYATNLGTRGPTPYPNGSDMVIGPSSGTPWSAPVGTCYFRNKFEAVDGDYLIYVCADNVVDLWFDGQLIHSSNNMNTTTRFAFTLTAGLHCLAAKVFNVSQRPPQAPGESNPLGLLLSVWTATGTTRINEILSTDNTWKIKEYPPQAPGDESGLHGQTLGTWRNGPARWFQRKNRSEQVETEIPNVVLLDMQKSIKNDAQQCTITIENTATPELGEIPETDDQWGKPGFYTWTRGQSQESKARWGHQTNEWNDVFVPNALIRTYQGFGGHDKTIAEGLADGNLVLTGEWLVDDVNAGTAGQLVLKCRDMGKLLVDQQMFPPLVPDALYPLKYYRYTTEKFTIPPVVAPGPIHDLEPVAMRYKQGSDTTVPHQGVTTTSSSDQRYGGFNTSVFGHHPSDAFDAGFVKNDRRFVTASLVATDLYGTSRYEAIERDDDYWLSDDPDDGVVYLEFALDGKEVNRIHVLPWGGNYMCYVSVFEGGGWVASEDGGYSGGVISAGGNAAKEIPYIFNNGLPWEQDTEIYLPRTYRADKIRLTFTGAIPVAVPGGNRVGIRQIGALMDYTHAHLHEGATTDSLCYASAAYPHIGTENHVGYWQGRDNGQIFAFGDARIHPASATNPTNVLTGRLIAIAPTVTGQGYWALDQFGRVVAYGDADHLGDLYDDGFTDITDMCTTFGGGGYLILRRNGTINAFGTAVGFGGGTEGAAHPWIGSPTRRISNFARAIAARPDDQGYWILWAGGQVEAFNCTHYGNSTRPSYFPTEYSTDLVATREGDGYWIMSGGARMEGFGTAEVPGNGRLYPPEQWVQGLCWRLIPSVETDGGFGVVHADGTINIIGDFPYQGSIAEGGGTIRKDGNYKDWVDIVKELLLWAGFYLYQSPQPPDEFPEVYGLFESTGSYSTQDLPVAMFDKVPIISPINAVKEAVGYIFYVDDEGGAHFQSPNWWSMGNYDLSGEPLDIMPEIDEKKNLTAYSTGFTDTNARSEIIVASADPNPTVQGQPAYSGVIVTRVIPPSAKDLKGLIKPAMWTNGLFIKPEEQKAMADLIGMHIWFSRRTGQTTCVANPLIGIDDQVRIYERNTGETYVHYVTDVHTKHDLKTGEYTMDLTHYWLGGSPYNEMIAFYGGAVMQAAAGYWQLASTGDVYAFGNASLYQKNDTLTHIAPAVGMRATATDQGYWTVDVTGKIISYGDAVNYGALTVDDTPRSEGGLGVVTDLAVTPTGAGYWLLQENGTVIPFGDANTHANGTHGADDSTINAVSLESHPLEDGYWILWSDGTVEPVELAGYGSAGPYTTPTTVATNLRRTASGNGYWVSNMVGDLAAFGDADDLGDNSSDAPGENTSPHDRTVHQIIPNFQGTGYALQHLDGSLLEFGDYPNLGDAGGSGYGSFEWVFGTEETVANRPPGTAISVSDDVVNLLKRGSSKSARNAVVSRFAKLAEITMKGT